MTYRDNHPSDNTKIGKLLILVLIIIGGIAWGVFNKPHPVEHIHYDISEIASTNPANR